MSGCIVVIGLGEVGRPLLKILRRNFEVLGLDLPLEDVTKPCSVLHICYPYQISDFVGETVGYICKYQPTLTVINSTVAPGTTRRIYEASGKPAIAFSPVRGKHTRMEEDLLRYHKFVVGCDAGSTHLALEHFAAAGFRTATFKTPEIGEVSKLLETTSLGVLVGWAQEMERIAGRFGGNFDEVNSFIKEIEFLPSQIFPGFIGGHCVMPNIEILENQINSKFLRIIVESNDAKRKEMDNSVLRGAL